MSGQRTMVQELKTLGLSERLACGLAGVARSSFRYRPPPPAADEEELRAEVLRLADATGATATDASPPLLRHQGSHVNAKRIYRIWKSAGLAVPRKRSRRRRKGPAVELPQRAERPNHREAELTAYITNQGGTAVIDGFRVTLEDEELRWEKLPQALTRQLAFPFMAEGADHPRPSR